MCKKLGVVSFFFFYLRNFYPGFLPVSSFSYSSSLSSSGQSDSSSLPCSASLRSWIFSSGVPLKARLRKVGACHGCRRSRSSGGHQKTNRVRTHCSCFLWGPEFCVWFPALMLCRLSLHRLFYMGPSQGAEMHLKWCAPKKVLSPRIEASESIGCRKRAILVWHSKTGRKPCVVF